MTAVGRSSEALDRWNRWNRPRRSRWSLAARPWQSSENRVGSASSSRSTAGPDYLPSVRCLPRRPVRVKCGRALCGATGNRNASSPRHVAESPLCKRSAAATSIASTPELGMSDGTFAWSSSTLRKNEFVSRVVPPTARSLSNVARRHQSAGAVRATSSKRSRVHGTSGLHGSPHTMNSPVLYETGRFASMG